MATANKKAVIALIIVSALGGFNIGAYVGVKSGERNWRKPCLAFLEEAVSQQNEKQAAATKKDDRHE